jgi:hypothetical protein
MELTELKGRWNEVLDELESTDRIAWLAFFDARLADLTDSVLTLDFSDATKFQDGHDLKKTLPESSHKSLIAAINNITGLTLTLEFNLVWYLCISQNELAF